MGLLKTRIERTDEPDDPALGKQFQRSPAFTASAAVDWKPLDSLRLSAQARHNAPYFSDDFETPSTRIGAATVVDAKAAWTMGRFTLSGYVRNMFDRFELRSLAAGSGFATAIDPREYGVGLEEAF